MTTEEKNVKYPENIPLKKRITESGKSVKFIASKIGYSTMVVSRTIHGHYKGMYIVPLIENELNK